MMVLGALLPSMESRGMQELITLQEAANRLELHVSTLRGWVREGRIRSYRLGKRFARVDWDEVLDALTKHRDGKPHVQPAAKQSGTGE